MSIELGKRLNLEGHRFRMFRDLSRNRNSAGLNTPLYGADLTAPCTRLAHAIVSAIYESPINDMFTDLGLLHSKYTSKVSSWRKSFPQL